MKRSVAVTLVLSGSLLAGCDRRVDPRVDSGVAGSPDDASLTNNTYRTGYGYWHAPYHRWYPLPYNYYNPSSGYYYDGRWSGSPVGEKASTGSSGFFSSHPSESSISRGGFGFHGSSAS